MPTVTIDCDARCYSDNPGSGSSGGPSSNRDYPSSSSDRDHGPGSNERYEEYGNNSGDQSYGGRNDDNIVKRYQNLMKGFTGQWLTGGNHDQRHCRDNTEKPPVNKELLASARWIDNNVDAKAVNFILFHDCYLNDDDMYWLSSIFNTHTPNGLAVNTVDLSNNCLTLVRDSNLGYVDLPFFSFNAPYNTPRNILRIDLSNNKIGDAGAKIVADGLANGVLPITKKINLSGNNITDTGKEKLVTAAKESLNQNLVVILEKQSSLDGVKSFMKKAFSYYRGEIKKYLDERQTTNEEVSKAALKVYGSDDWAHCKKFLAEGGVAVGMGVAAKVSNPITQKVLKAPNPHVKAGVVGAIVIDASIDAMGSVDWKDAGYCIATLWGKALGKPNYFDSENPVSSVDFMGNNQEYEQDF